MSGSDCPPEKDESKVLSQQSAARLLADIASSGRTDKREQKESQPGQNQLPELRLVQLEPMSDSKAKDVPTSSKTSPLDVTDKKQRDELVQAVRGLSSDNFVERETAKKTLQEHGAQALPFLLEKLKSISSDDLDFTDVTRSIKEIVDARYNTFVGEPLFKDIEKALEPDRICALADVFNLFRLSKTDDKTAELRTAEIACLLEIMKDPKKLNMTKEEGDELEARRALLEEHKKEYADIKKIRDESGSIFNKVRNLEISSATDESASVIKFCKNLSKVYIGNPEVAAIAMTYLKDLKNLTWLKCHGADDKELALIKDLPTIKHLDLIDHPKITDAGMQHLSNFSDLTALYITDGSSVTDKGVAALAHLKKLRMLSLPGTKITDAGLKHLNGLEHLVVLNLSDTAVMDVGLEHLKSLKNLEELNLSGTAITDVGLKHLEGLKNLYELRLAKTAVTDAGLEHLKGLEHLAVLSLSKTIVTNGGLERLKGLKNLEQLNLSSTAVTDDGLKHLSGLKNLRDLNLELTGITDKAFDTLDEMKSLRSLRLPAKGTTEDGVKKLKLMLPDCEIFRSADE